MADQNDRHKEAGERFNNLLQFCDVMGLHMEPALKSAKATMYHAGNVLHTRIIDSSPMDLAEISKLDPATQKIYKQTCNHDGYKSARYLMRSEDFNKKPTFFVQAMVPSIFVTNRRRNLYLIYKKARKELDQTVDYQKVRELQIYIDALMHEMSLVTNHFNIDDFLYYRHWFFDLDYSHFLSPESVLEFFKEIDLDCHVNAIVQTSPTKYHVYLKSEMVASEAHMKKWPSPTPALRLGRLLKPETLKKLSLDWKYKSGYDWFDVSRRGIPQQANIDAGSSPVPLDAKLKRGMYYGDDEVYQDYIAGWKKINQILGGDPKVFNETRVAQLPGYTNPKNGFTAKIVYENKDAQVLSTRKVKNETSPKIDSFLAAYGPFYAERSKVEIPRLEIIADKVTEIEKSLEPSENVASSNVANLAKSVEFGKNENNKHNSIKFGTPSSPEDYARVHGIFDKIRWEERINGHSNEMLLVLSRYAFCHIKLDDEKQQKIYFDQVIAPYFMARKSIDINKKNGLKDFFIRFKSLCAADARKGLSSGNKLKGLEFDDVLRRFENQLISMLGESHSIVTSKGHKKLRNIICQYVVKAGKGKGDSGDSFEFFLPAAMLNAEVFGYRQKLKEYEKLGIYQVSETYTMPKKVKGKPFKAGECKRHILILENEVVEIKMQERGIVKNSISIDNSNNIGIILNIDDSGDDILENSLVSIDILLAGLYLIGNNPDDDSLTETNKVLKQANSFIKKYVDSKLWNIWTTTSIPTLKVEKTPFDLLIDGRDSAVAILRGYREVVIMENKKLASMEKVVYDTSEMQAFVAKSRLLDLYKASYITAVQNSNVKAQEFWVKSSGYFQHKQEQEEEEEKAKLEAKKKGKRKKGSEVEVTEAKPFVPIGDKSPMEQNQYATYMLNMYRTDRHDTQAALVAAVPFNPVFKKELERAKKAVMDRKVKLTKLFLERTAANDHFKTLVLGWEMKGDPEWGDRQVTRYEDYFGNHYNRDLSMSDRGLPAELIAERKEVLKIYKQMVKIENEIIELVENKIMKKRAKLPFDPQEDYTEMKNNNTHSGRLENAYRALPNKQDVLIL